MELSRLDVLQSSAACSRVFFKRDMSPELTGLRSRSDTPCLSASAPSPANQSSRGPVATLRSLPPQSGGAPRASSVTGTSHQ